MIINIPKSRFNESDGSQYLASNNLEFQGLSFGEESIKRGNHYIPPNLYEEADEMLQMSLLIYAVTQIRSLAKRRQKRKKLPQNDDSEHELDVSSSTVASYSSSSLPSSPTSSSSLEQILLLPLSFDTCIGMIEDKFECIAQDYRSNDQDSSKNPLKMTQKYYTKYIYRRQQRWFQKKNSSRQFTRWWTPASNFCKKGSSSSSKDGKSAEGSNNRMIEGYYSAMGHSELVRSPNTINMGGRNCTEREGKGKDVKPMKAFRTDLTPPSFVAYGDDTPNKGLVFAIAVDPVRKRITVVFRGSVNISDFFAVTSIALNQRPNPIQNATEATEGSDSGCCKTQKQVVSRSTFCENNNMFVGIHSGFYKYLFHSPSKQGSRKRRGKKGYVDVDEDNGKYSSRSGSDSKYKEILEILIGLFEKHKGYKLYLTGHSLGGALATLFSFYVAASLALVDATKSNEDNMKKGGLQSISNIPTPISCVSIASPRVGDQHFQNAFQSLEQSGYLQHLRVVNDGDPVTAVPKKTGKNTFRPRGACHPIAKTYHHTGMKLKLCRKELMLPSEAASSATTFNGTNSDSSRLYDYDFNIRYSCDPNFPSSPKLGMIRKLTSSVRREEIPYLFDHFGLIYHGNLKNVKNELMNMTMIDLYKKHMVTKSRATPILTTECVK